MTGMTAAGDLQKRSMKLNGRRTSVLLESEFWASLEAEAARRNISLARCVADIDEARRETQSLASAVRCMILRRARTGGVVG